MKRPTLHDVARQAGVSAKTVSRVVNAEPYVTQKVRDAVNAAILATGYEPNVAARLLASDRSYLVGALGPHIENSSFHRLNTDLVRACARRGRSLLIEHFDTDLETVLLRLSGLLARIRFEGVVLTPGLSDARGVIELLEQQHINYVAVTPRELFGQTRLLLVDEASGEEALAEHLWSFGHRRFVVLRAPPRAMMERGSAFVGALAKLSGGDAEVRELEINLAVPELEAGRLAAIEILEFKERPTAVFAFSDSVAAGLVSFLLAKGVRVPDEMSVAGFDDADIARAIWPALTTLRQPIELMAEAAASLLLDQIDGAGGQVVCPVELVVRSSTATAPSLKQTTSRRTRDYSAITPRFT